MPIESSEPNQSELITRFRRLLQEMRIQNNSEAKRKSELIKQKIEKTLNTISSTHEENTIGIRNSFEQKVREIQISVEKENRGFETSQKHKIREIKNQLETFTASIKPGGWDWNSLELEDFGKKALSRSKFIRIGSLSVDTGGICPDLPALVDIGQKNIVIHTNRDASQSCASLVKNIILKLLITLPPQMIKLHLIDPLGLGSNFEFLEPGRSSFSENVISDLKSIEKLLSEIRQAITDTRSKLLGGKYTDIQEYNEKVGGHHLDYHFIILLDFPKWYSQQVATDLIPILQSGPEAGVFMIFHTNESEEIPEYWKWNDRSFSKKVININVKGGKASWDLDQFSGYEIKLENLPEETFISQIIQTANAGKDSLMLPILPYEKIAIPEVDWGKGDSTPSISVPMGIAEDSEIFEITLGQESSSIHHGIIGGMIGSGKGNFLRVLITQLVSKYSPEELELYLLDFKQAQDLGNYQTHPVKHIRATIGNDDLFSGLVILRWLKSEKSRRSIEMGTAVKLEELRRTGKKLSRILVIIDEFPKLLSDKTYGPESQELLKELAKEGRAYGIHIFLSTQTLENLADMRTAYGQMGLRVALKVEDPSHSEKMLGPGNTKASELEEIGLAIINQATRGKADKTTKVKIAFLENEKQRDILQKINQQYGKAETRILGYEKPKKIIDDLEQFYGNKRPDKKDGEVLIGVGVSSELKIGDSGTIVNNTYIPLNEEHGSNILLVGSDQEQAKQILQSAIISFTYQTHSSSKVKLLTFPKIRNSIQGLSAYVDNRLEFVDPDNMINELIQADNLIQERLSSNDDTYDPILFLFFGIGRISKINQPLGDNLRDVKRNITTTASLITSIIKDGSKVGIHSIIWVEQYAEMNIFGRQLDDLKLRIALHGLTIDGIRKTLELDAIHKINLPNADQAYYRNLGFSEEFERFTPYLQLNQDELQRQGHPK